jgi:uncharacterized damage-inducible protein DinB
MNIELIKQIKEIDRVHDNYLSQARHLSHEQFNRKPAADQWSLAQVLYHLWNASNFTQSFMEKRIAEKKVTQAAGLKSAVKSIILQIALAAPVKFKAPRAVSEIPAEMSFAELENNFKKTAENFERMMQQFPKEYEDKEIFKHPRTGYINAAQTFRFLKAHALHHQPQIEALVRV